MSLVKYLMLSTYLLWMIFTSFRPVMCQGTLPDRSATSQYPFSTDLDPRGDYVLRYDIFT